MADGGEKVTTIRDGDAPMRAPGGSDRGTTLSIYSEISVARRLSAIEGASMDAHTLKSMAIVSLAEGTKLGYVTEPLLDLAARRLVALLVKGESGTFIVPFDRVAAIGADAITVESSAATQTPSTGGMADGLGDLDALRKLMVVDRAGTLLGTISRVEIDPATGAITQLAAHTGGMLGMGGTTTHGRSSASGRSC
jgi:sporulation protein YlmC with PRC-barrel domain